MQLSKDTHISQIKAASTAATTGIESSTVDMQGFGAVTIFTTIATANAGNFMTASQGDESDGSDMATLEGSKVTAESDADVVAIEIIEPEKRYVEVDITRGASTAVGEIWAVKSQPRVMPTDWADEITIVQSPDEGTP